MAADDSTPLPDLAVAVRGLTKVYGRGGVRALDSVDLAVPRGAVFGLLGPNGAGKSTLINILGGLVIKSAGTAHIWDIDIDRDPRNARAAIGIVPQELNLDVFATPREALEMQAGLYAVPRRERRTAEILEILGLTDKADAYARTLSGGMRRRLLIGKAMVHSPPVLVLDEPTAGVDVELREQLWESLRGLNRDGTTVILTTHNLDEAQALCGHIAIIDRGRVIADEATSTLLGRLDDKRLRITLDRPVGDLPGSLAGFPVERERPDAFAVRYRPSRTTAGAILEAARAAGLAVRDLSTEEPDLEGVFRHLTRRTAAQPMAGGVK